MAAVVCWNRKFSSVKQNFLLKRARAWHFLTNRESTIMKLCMGEGCRKPDYPAGLPLENHVQKITSTV